MIEAEADTFCMNHSGKMRRIHINRLGISSLTLLFIKLYEKIPSVDNGLLNYIGGDTTPIYGIRPHLLFGVTQCYEFLLRIHFHK